MKRGAVELWKLEFYKGGLNKLDIVQMKWFSFWEMRNIGCTKGVCRKGDVMKIGLLQP